MKFIEAKYKDICMKCAGVIEVGDMIMWEKKNSRHAECTESVVGKWLKHGQR